MSLIIYKINENFFEKWSKEMAWVLGIIATDGNIKRNFSRVRIGLQDKDILIKINKMMESNYPIRKIDFNKYEGWGTWYYQIDICRIKICRDLVELGITPRKSQTIKFPSIPKNYLYDFIRGVIDGNGCMSVNKYFYKGKLYKYFRVTILSGSFKFLKELRRLLNVKNKICWNSQNCYRLEIPKNIITIIYSNIGQAFGQRKYNKWLNHTKEVSKNAVPLSG